MALGWIWWHAWGPVTRRGTLRGRSGAWRHSPSFCVTGVALGDIDLRFAWRAGTGLDLGGALGGPLVAGDAVALCVAGVALAPFCVAGVALISYMALELDMAVARLGPVSRR